MEENVMNNEVAEEAVEAAQKVVDMVPKHSWKTAACWGIGTLAVAGVVSGACWLYKKYGTKKTKESKPDNMAVVKNDFEESSDKEDVEDK